MKFLKLESLFFFEYERNNEKYYLPQMKLSIVIIH